MVFHPNHLRNTKVNANFGISKELVPFLRKYSRCLFSMFTIKKKIVAFLQHQMDVKSWLPVLWLHLNPQKKWSKFCYKFCLQHFSWTLSIWSAQVKPGHAIIILPELLIPIYVSSLCHSSCFKAYKSNPNKRIRE